jgi:hypothetical protein
MSNLLTDESRSIESVKMTDQMRHDIVLYKHKLISKEELLNKYPNLDIVLSLVEEEVNQNFKKNYEEFLKYIKEQVRGDIISHFLTLLGPILAYNQLLLNAPYIAYVKPSYHLSKFIADEITHAFGNSNNKMDKVSKIIFIIIFTGIFASYGQSLQWAFWYGKEAYPILILRIRALMNDTFNTLLTELSIHKQKIQGEAVGIFFGLFSGTTGENTKRKLLELFSSISIVATSYTLALLKTDGADLDVKDIKDIPDGKEIYDEYKKIKPHFKQEDHISSFTLLTVSDIHTLTKNFTKVSNIGMELVLYEQSPIEKYSKILSLIQELQVIYENPETTIASSMTSLIAYKALEISPDITSLIDLNQLVENGKIIDNRVNDNLRLMRNDIEYYTTKIGQSWNSRSLFLPKGKEVHTLFIGHPYSPTVKLETIGINVVDYMLFSIILLSLVLFFRRNLKKERGPRIEVLDQRIRRHRK